ncbi:MAG TPA: DUF3738 domain-containing protein [Candidatus Angelobacter sp.]|nr:DUF3738 domain-containing protein [Candidatus Angelobacter sp.]
MESIFREPVINRTGITGNNSDIDLRWNEKDWNHHNLEDLKRELIDQLGLELVPSREPIQVLVVEKVK